MLRIGYPTFENHAAQYEWRSAFVRRGDIASQTLERRFRARSSHSDRQGLRGIVANWARPRWWLQVNFHGCVLRESRGAMPDFSAERPCRILSLDGGGAKGFYTIGVLKGIEGMLGCRLHERFDLVFGTSTGSIIAALKAPDVSDAAEPHLPW